MTPLRPWSIGCYTLPQAARYIGASPRNVRHWARGYRRGAAAAVPPVTRVDYEGGAAISFADLVEMRLIAALRGQGVSLQAVRKCWRRARELFDHPHPFTAARLQTDGRTVFADIARDEGDDALLDLATNHYGMRDLLAPWLRGLDFGADGYALRLRPCPEAAPAVVLDPRRAFGHAILDQAGIPTETLAAAARAEGSIDRVARLYEIAPADVRQAVEFEQRLAA
jgi:uncharacterized protein (DUF433 family)